MNGEVESVSVRTSVGGDRTGRVSRPVCYGELSSSARRRELVIGCPGEMAGGPVPPSVPGEFVVCLGAVVSGGTLRGLKEGMAVLGGAGVVLSWLEWVEVEVRGFDDVVEGLRLLRGVVMSVAAVGKW
jgi:hypothetical protein